MSIYNLMMRSVILYTFALWNNIQGNMMRLLVGRLAEYWGGKSARILLYIYIQDKERTHDLVNVARVRVLGSNPCRLPRLGGTTEEGGKKGGQKRQKSLCSVENLGIYDAREPLHFLWTTDRGVYPFFLSPILPSVSLSICIPNWRLAAIFYRSLQQQPNSQRSLGPLIYFSRIYRYRIGVCVCVWRSKKNKKIRSSRTYVDLSRLFISRWKKKKNFFLK